MGVSHSNFTLEYMYIDAAAFSTLYSSLTGRTLVRVEAHADADTAGSVLKIGGGINNAVLKPFLALINIELTTYNFKRSKM